MTGTKQLPGHFYHLLDLLWQMLNRGRPTPTNSNGKKPLPGSIAGTAKDLEGLLRPTRSILTIRQTIIKIPKTISPTPTTRPNNSPRAVNFSINTNAVIAAIQNKFITPATKSRAIIIQQQPTQ